MRVRRLSESEEDIIVVCAWCLKEKGEKTPPGVVSHGVCKMHKEKFLRDLECEIPGRAKAKKKSS